VSDPRDALDAIGHLPDVEIDIAGAALQLARVDAPDADWQAAQAHLSALARDAVVAGADIALDDLQGKASALSRLIAERYGYRGDTETYDDLVNANLVRVIERRRGLPVALGILWLHTARAAGWAAHGVDFPGHFLVALEGRGSKTALDVFDGGRALEARDLRALIKRIEGENAELRPGLLQPMSTRGVLLRLQNNIMTRRLAGGDIAEALTCCKDMLRIAPDNFDLWRRAGVMHQKLDQVAAALACFERCLELVPSGDAAARIRTAIGDLRMRLN
jgi:regulator of sirC expression with transglutaminase-like and TPR domain